MTALELDGQTKILTNYPVKEISIVDIPLIKLI